MNLYGQPLVPCNLDKVTGYDRSGYCTLFKNDPGTHIVCAIVDERFLKYTKSKGNDLISSSYNFPGLKPGDKWCICIMRWIEAYKANSAPKIDPYSTALQVLNFVDRDIIKQYIIN